MEVAGGIEGGYRIGKRFTFDASHCLPGLPAGHRCARLHGHTYTVEVVIAASELVEPGFVTDFANLAPLGRYLDECFDHRHLNDVLDTPPTSEHLARHLAHWCARYLEPAITGQVVAGRVSESLSSWAEYALADARSGGDHAAHG